MVIIWVTAANTTQVVFDRGACNYAFGFEEANNPSGASRQLPLHRGANAACGGYTSSGASRQLPLHRGANAACGGYTSSGASRPLTLEGKASGAGRKRRGD
ncbi:MAG: hypothetical protein IJU94_03530 [Clostridia bacterium]|nr:hypothetical protein [Clostridia bacterium]